MGEYEYKWRRCDCRREEKAKVGWPEEATVGPGASWQAMATPHRGLILTFPSQTLPPRPQFSRRSASSSIMRHTTTPTALFRSFVGSKIIFRQVSNWGTRLLEVEHKNEQALDSCACWKSVQYAWVATPSRDCRQSSSGHSTGMTPSSP